MKTKKTPNSHQAPTRRFLRAALMYALVGLMIVTAPALGAVVAAIGVWHSILAWSIYPSALALAVLLVATALIYSHKKADLALLALVTVGTAAGLLIETQTRFQLLGWAQALAAKPGWLPALLALMSIALVLIYIHRMISARADRKSPNLDTTLPSTLREPAVH